MKNNGFSEDEINTLFVKIRRGFSGGGRLIHSKDVVVSVRKGANP